MILDYKESPGKKLKDKIKRKFNKFCQPKTDCRLLDLALKRFIANKDELLLVLERPELPLHNNLSERDIGEYVKRRKISGSTRSKLGQQCRDTFTSLKKTAKKLGVHFWDYLLDRLMLKNQIAALPTIMETAAS